ncbi:TIR domain-containing protein [Bradyrhizobium sp.]|jgi:hypothetical protein|uniref:TIR domain-containing protein n=1 Tax=Bradyrhizobium sp. TaxID=376 RepID=UPI002DDDA7C3|nr:TIR domain-containing protein [Bradyrhizobium sp.]HEV2153001.1 TIR domain-containing protein [Bradyrhizobium sp.]
MTYSQIGALFAVKHRVFVSYHHGGDQAFYDKFSSVFHDAYETIYDNSLERAIDSDNAEYVRRRIREDFIKGTSCTIVLVGAQTWGRKYVDWEIDASLEMNHALIGVRLPTAPVSGGKVTVPGRLHDNIVSGYALWESWESVTSGAAKLDACIAAAKLRENSLINNVRSRRLRNA